MNPVSKQQTPTTAPSSQTSHFLHLPPSVRQKIYTAVHTIGWNGPAFINLNQRKWLHINSTNSTSNFEVTLSLLLTCKTIYHDLVPQVYGNNHFFIRYNDFMNLTSLRRLSSLAVSSLTKLTIHLNVASCGLGDVCDGMLYWSTADEKSDYDRLDKPLSLNDSINRAVLEEWHRVWTETLLPSLIGLPARLELNLICDVADGETAFFAMQPLLKPESQAEFSSCRLRLCRQVSERLQRLARKVVKHLTGPPNTRSTQTSVAPSRDEEESFRFFDLPVELQRHVLSFTDLVTPHREVEWSNSKGIRWRYKVPRLRNEYPYGYLNPNNIHGRILSPSASSYEQANSRSYKGCWERTHPSGCYCLTFHSAAASENIIQCQCWTRPTDLFLVNKAFSQLAMSTFYGSNRFIITPRNGATYNKFYAQRPKQPLLPASIFFRKIVPSKALPYLRFVEIVFPPFGEGGPFDYCPPNSPQWMDWVRTLDYVKDKLTLSSLTIRIIFAPWIPNMRGWSTPPSRVWMNDEHYPTWMRRQKKSYMDVILPMKRLRGLKAFFAHLTVPDPVYQGEIMRLDELEEEAERVVMGIEYDAKAAGKEMVEESVWVDRHRLTEYQR